MKKRIFVSGALLLGLVLTYQIAQSDDEHYAGEHQLFEQTKGVAPPNDPLYISECGACHMAYPPGLLPAGSWKRVMKGLDNHFGDNAELDPATSAKLTGYLLEHSADTSNYRRSKKIMRSVDAANAPLRITELPYIRHKHSEIPKRLIKQNPKVGSLSHCNACHQGAEKGIFSERQIRIPGYGRWDD
jgi:hypothetical protein